MSSLITKAGKSRSQASQKARTKKGKKAAPKKSQRPAKSPAKKPQKTAKASPSPKKKARAVKSAKKSTVSRKLTAKSKPAPTSRKPSKAAPLRVAKKPSAKKVTGRKTIAKRRPTAKPVQPPPKKMPPSTASIALKSFDQAVKIFNRHDFTGAKSAFESLLDKFGEQLDIVALARKYLALCDQRLASARSVPRSPDALYDQGIFEFNNGNVKGAIALFDKALKAAPQADHILYSLAAAHARLDDAPKAMEALRRAVAFQPVHRSHARQDLDFASLHDNEAFRQLTGFGFDLSEE